MWSVWGDVLDIYICRGHVWVGLPGERVFDVSVPASLPLGQLLQKVGDALPARKGGLFRRVRISLSVSYCVPVTFEVPQGASAADLKILALRAGSQHWGVESHEVECAADPSVKGLAASMPSSLTPSLHAWANGRGMKCKSIRPMWAMVPSYGRRGANARYTFVEPDGAVKIDFSGEPDARVQVALAARPGALREEDHPTRFVWQPPGPEDIFGPAGWTPFFSQLDHHP